MRCKLHEVQHMSVAARNLRAAERFLLVPPLAASFGATPVALSDLSVQGARFRHDLPIEAGSKAVLHVPVEGRPAASVEAMIVWTHPDAMAPRKFFSGVRSYGSTDVM